MPSLSTPTVPIDLLGAVNILLAAIGQAQIATLITADLKEDARKALEVLGQTSVNVQSRGWEFNTDRDVILDPAPDGTITVPSTCSMVKTVGAHRRIKVVQRGLKLWRPDKQTYVIGQSLKVDMQHLLAFEDLPQPARWYVTCLAARRFAVPELASASAYQFTQTDENTALAQLEQYDTEITDRTMGEVNPHIVNMRRR